MSILNLLDFTGRAKTPVILQNEISECGLACLAMIASYHGYKTDLGALQRQKIGTGRGARLSDLIQIAAKLKLGARPVKLELENFFQLQLPAVLHWDFNHFVVLTRVRNNGIELHDPGSGRRNLSWDQVSKHFTGVALELTPETDFQPKEDKRKISLKQLLGRVQGVRRAVVTVLLLALALEVFTLAAPLFMQLVVDSAIVSNDRDLLGLLAIGFLMLGLIRVAVTTLRGWVIMVLSNQLNLQLLGNLFRHLVRLPLVFFERRHLGDIVSRFDSMGTIQRTLTGSFLEALIDGLMVITTLIMMLVYAGSLTAIVVAAAAAYAVLRITLYQPLRQAQEEEITRRAKQHSHFLETVRGIQSIKLFGRQLLRRTQYENLLADQFNAGIRVDRLGLVYQTLNGFLFAVENIIVVWVAASMILNGGFSIGMLFAFMAYKQQFIGRATALVEKGIELKMLGLHTERVADIALAEPEPEQSDQIALLNPNNLDLEVSGLSFRYADNEPPVLNDLSFKIGTGESVAITGPSGCGKTTLVKLMLGLLTPGDGKIKVGGVAIDALDASRYRSLIGTVMQDDQLFAGSIADNITFFDPTPDWELMQQCAAFAAVHVEVINMPMQYHTMVGDMGSVLSGGQKQRVLLARALYKKPKILILDEATSHLDVGCEKLVSEAVMCLPLTRIIIAHRPETIASAERIIDLQRPTNGSAGVDHTRAVDDSECLTAS